MPAPLAKLIPSATLVVIFGYLTWSYLEMAPTPPPPTAKLPEIAKNMLDPKLPETTARDPFGDSVRFELGEFKKDDGRNRKGLKTAGNAKPEGSTAAKETRPQANVPAPPGTAGAKKPGTAGAARPAAAKPPVETRTASKEDLTDVVAGLALSATVLRGSQGFAVINGREYRTGQTLSTSGSDAQLVVSEIQRHRVVLKQGDADFVLNYSDRTTGEKKSGRPNTGKPPAPGTNGAKPKPKSPANGQVPPKPQQARN